MEDFPRKDYSLIFNYLLAIQPNLYSKEKEKGLI